MIERIGHLVIEDKLGEGGMGVVYRARDTRLERLVAVKMLPPATASDAEALARFEREARMIAALSHPNIATIFGLEEEDGHIALVMELVDGVSLGVHLRGGALEVAEALDLCAQVALALEAAHGAGIVHRDLKPGNVMVTPEGVAKLLDFGLARRKSGAGRADSSSDVHTRTGIILGSPGYLSPEQVLGQETDARADLWALGCILFECLVGRRAFEAESDMASIVAILHSEPDLGLLPDDLPPVLTTLVTSLLEKEPESRPASAREVRETLEGLRGSSFGGGTRTFLRPSGTIETRATDRTTVIEAPVQGNLPAEISTFIGRTEECDRLLGELASSRLVTLTGAGGIGKSRLALQVARAAQSEHPDGCWLIDLAELAAGETVAGELADAIGILTADGQPVTTLLAEKLRDRRALIVLDNCEHLLTQTVTLARELLGRCQHLRVLATSRESLAVAGEIVHRVPPLEFPANPQRVAPTDLERSEAVKLFLERARLLRPELEADPATLTTIAGICQRLDGIPLAIELAAARIRMLTVDQIAARLDNAFRLLKTGSRDASPRQQTLRALIDWSYDLLEAEERELLCRLAVFAGGWNLTTAAQVCLPDADELELLDLLEPLVEKSLIMIDEREGDEQRYRLLQTMRQYLLERLDESGETEELRRLHFETFLEIADSSRDQLYGKDQAHWMGVLDREIQNLHQAIDWGLAQDDRGDDLVKLCTRLSLYWSRRARYSSGVSYLKRTLEHPDSQTRSEERRIALNFLAFLATRAGRFEIAHRAVAESCEIAEVGGEPDKLTSSLHYKAELALHQGRPAEAREVYVRNLELLRQLGVPRRIAACLHNLAMAQIDLGERDAPQAALEEALTINRAEGNEMWAAYNLDGLGDLHEMHGELDSACGDWTRALEAFRRQGEDERIADALFKLAAADLVAGREESATERLEESLRHARACGEHQLHASILREQAELALAREDPDATVQLLRQAFDVLEQLAPDPPGTTLPRCLLTVARLARSCADDADAETLENAALTLRQRLAAREGELALTRHALDRRDQESLAKRLASSPPPSSTDESTTDTVAMEAIHLARRVLQE